MVNPVKVTSPERIRALAHPIRIRLLDLLNAGEVLTATECGARIDESTASCSFHLRLLEKYGFAERAEPRGREKPWRAAARSWSMQPDVGQPGSLSAVQELASMTVDAESQRLHAFLAQMNMESAEWVESTALARSTFWATAEELAQVNRDLRAIADRFAGRVVDPSCRPSGARLVHMLAVTNPDPVPGRAESSFDG